MKRANYTNNKVKGSSKDRKIRVVIREGFIQQMGYELDLRDEGGWLSGEEMGKYPNKKAALGWGLASEHRVRLSSPEGKQSLKGSRREFRGLSQVLASSKVSLGQSSFFSIKKLFYDSNLSACDVVPHCVFLIILFFFT